MNKRGQITIFIIIGVIIVAVAILIFLLRDNFISKNPVDPQVAQINDFVNDCLEETGNNALIQIGEQGGYGLLSDNIRAVEKIPIYTDGKRNFSPSLEIIEREISFVVKEELSYCILNFVDIKNNYDSIEGEIDRVETLIDEDRVRINLIYPIIIEKAETKYEIKKFDMEFNIRIFEYYNITQEIVNEQLKHPESICLSCNFELSKKFDVNIDMYDYSNATVFTIIDETRKINNSAYEWRFAIK